MKNLIETAAIHFLLLLPLAAQTGDGYGFLNIANLIPGKEPCAITIGGETLVPDGLRAGTYTGWFMVKAGTKTMSITMGELNKASGNIVITEGVANLIGIYLEPDKRIDPEGKSYPPRIRTKTFPAYDTKGFGLRFVSLCPEEKRFQLGNLKFQAEPLKPVEIPKWNGSGFEIICAGQEIGRTTGVSESGAFHMLVGTDHNGAYTSVLVSTNHQEVPEYLKPEKKEPATPAKPAPKP